MPPDENIRTHKGATDILQWVMDYISKEFMEVDPKSTSTSYLDEAIVNAAAETFQTLEKHGSSTSYLQHFKSLIAMSLIPELSKNSLNAVDVYRRIKISRRLFGFILFYFYWF